MTNQSMMELHPRRFDIPLLIVTSAVLLGMGLSHPIMTTRKLWESNTFSILSSVTTLWDSHDHVLALIIFFFSIVFPIVKLSSLLALWFIRMNENLRRNCINGLEILGRWSMLDVFVSGLLIVSVKLGAVASAKLEIGIYYFAASIFAAMAAATLQGSLIKRKA